MVKSITSTQASKERIKNHMDNLKTCGTGLCLHENSVAICEIIGALDVHTGGAILNPAHRYEASIKIAPQDLRGMQLIYSQCRPSNYQYWNSESVLRVAYNPHKDKEQSIAKYLEIDSQPQESAKKSAEAKSINNTPRTESTYILIQTNDKTPTYIDEFPTKDACNKGRSILLKLGKAMNPSKINHLHCIITH